MKTLLALALLGVMSLAGPAQAHRIVQSSWIDCDKASSPVEHLICSNNSMLAKDGELSLVYDDVLHYAPNKKALKTEQRAWLSTQRNRCQDAACLNQVYDQRIHALIVEGVGGIDKVLPKLTGTYITKHSDLEIKQLPNGHLSFEVAASYEDQFGSVLGEVAVNGHTAKFDDPQDDDCHLLMTFGQSRVYIQQTGRCGSLIRTWARKTNRLQT